MSDEIDQAQALTQMYTDHAIARHHARQDVPPRESAHGRLCVDCADPISPQRLQAVPAAVRCIECQTLQERV